MENVVEFNFNASVSNESENTPNKFSTNIINVDRKISVVER